jgi:sirohydrochlorin cobaltochelatase
MSATFEDPVHAPGGPLGLVLLAHGSRSPDTVPFYAEMCRRLEARLGSGGRAGYAFLSGQPSLEEAAAALLEAGVTRLRVVPLLLAPGRHLAEDVPALMGKLARRHPGVPLDLTPLPSQVDAFLDLLLALPALPAPLSGPVDP